MRGFHGAFVALRSAYYGCPSDVYGQFGMSGMPDRKPCGSFKGSKNTVFGGSRVRGCYQGYAVYRKCDYVFLIIAKCPPGNSRGMYLLHIVLRIVA